MNKIQWSLCFLEIMGMVMYVSSSISHLELNNNCGQIYTVNGEETFVATWNNETLAKHICEIQFIGQVSNVIDLYRVCIEKVFVQLDGCSVSLYYLQNKAKKYVSNKDTDNGDDLPERWCGEVGQAVSIGFQNIKEQNLTSSCWLQIKVVVMSSNTYIKTLTIILFLVFGAILITALVSCVIKYYSRKRAHPNYFPNVFTDIDSNSDCKQQDVPLKIANDGSCVNHNLQSQMYTYLPPSYSSLEIAFKEGEGNHRSNQTGLYSISQTESIMPPPYSSVIQ